MSSRNPTFYELFPIDSDHLGSDAMQMLCESDPPIRLVSIISNESKSKSSGMTHSLTHGENCDCDSSMEVSKDLMISRSYDVEDWYRSHFPTATGFTKEGGNICFSLIHGKCERHCLPLICASQVVLLVTSTKEKEDILAKILELAVLNDCVKLDENETTEKWKFATLIVLVEGLTQDDCDSILIPEPTKKGSKETKPNRQINQINEAFMFIHCISMTPSKETSNSPIEHVVDLIFANASDCLSWKDYQLTGSRLGSFLLKSLDQIRKSDRIVIQEVLEKMMTAEVQPILDQNEKNISSTADQIEKLLPLDNDCLEQKLAKLVAYNETDLKKDLLQSLKEFYIRYTAGQLEYRKKKIKEKNRELVEEDINKAIADAKAQLPIWFTEKRDESELRNLFKDTLLKLKKQLKNLDCQHRLGKDLVQLEQDFEAQLISYRKKNSHENQHKVEILEVSRSKSTSPGSLETRDKLMNYNEFRTAFAKRHGSTSREGQSLAWAEYKKTGGSSFKKL